MFLPKLFIETHGITVNRVFDMPSLTHERNYVNFNDFLDDFPPEVQKQLVCTEKTKKFGKLLDDHYEERKGFSMEELRIELEDANMDGGAIFEIYQRVRSGLTRILYVYCDTLEELQEFTTSVVVKLEQAK